jgi:hypothetical protein
MTLQCVNADNMSTCDSDSLTASTLNVRRLKLSSNVRYQGSLANSWQPMIWRASSDSFSTLRLSFRLPRASN